MNNDVVRVFELFGNSFEITAEFDAYNKTRSQQARDVYAVFNRYKPSIDSMAEDLSRLTKKALDDLIPVISQVNTKMAVASVGFAELKRYQSEVLSRIGKRMIFKYCQNELITVDEVAKHIRLDVEKHFSGFLNEVQKIADKQKSDWVRREYVRMTRSTPAVGGSIGTGMSAAVGAMAANAGRSLLQGLGSRIAQAMDESETNSARTNAVRSGWKAIYAAFYDMVGQLNSYCINTLKSEMDAETAKIIRKPFKEVSKERREKEPRKDCVKENKRQPFSQEWEQEKLD